MDNLVYLFRKYFMLRVVVTVGLCVLAAVVVGSGLRGNSAVTSLSPIDLDQPARLVVQAPGTSTTKGSEAEQSVAANTKNTASLTSASNSGSPANNGNVSSLGQALKILATKPIDTEAAKGVAATDNAANVKTNAQPQTESVVASKNKAVTNQPVSEAAKGR